MLGQDTSMNEALPINSEVLTWARKSMGLEVGALADKMKVSVDQVLRWESGDSGPTYPQLEKLASQYLKRPIAVFFSQQSRMKMASRQTFALCREHCLIRFPILSLVFIVRQNLFNTVLKNYYKRDQATRFFCLSTLTPTVTLPV